MKLTLDPYMYRHLPIPEMVKKVAELGYKYIELSPRDDFFPFYKYPRVDHAKIQEFKKALNDNGVQIASLIVMQHWAGPKEEDREAAVRNWKRCIEVAVELGVDVINTEFTGHSDKPYICEQMFMRSMEELLPIIEKSGVHVHIQAHPFDFIERNDQAVDLIRGINRDYIGYFYAVPHTFFYDDGKGDIDTMLEYAKPVLKHINIADTYNHRGSSGLRYIVNPPGVNATVHQHLDIGKGDINWDMLWNKLKEIEFDGIATVAIFGEEERADDSSRFMLEEVKKGLGLN